MGTYTTNKNLFMPTVGEQGWGELVNNNFSTIDNFLKPITVSGNTYTFTGNQTGGSISATSITNSGTLTSTGKITGNGGIGTTSLTTSSTITSTGLITANGGIKGNLTGNATTATNLNRTVTVGVSSTVIVFDYGSSSHSFFYTFCPYTTGVLYTGKVKCNAGTSSSGSYGNTFIYTLSSSNVWNTATVSNTSVVETSFTKVKCVLIRFMGSGSMTDVSLYLPTFT